MRTPVRSEDKVVCTVESFGWTTGKWKEKSDPVKNEVRLRPARRTAVSVDIKTAGVQLRSCSTVVWCFTGVLLSRQLRRNWMGGAHGQ